MSDLAVYCATQSMSSYYNTYFDSKVIGHEDKMPDHIDLLILTGGSDIHPARYKEHPNGAVGWDRERDEREFNILSEALERYSKVKVLGVCRGMQLLNIYNGGSLHQDLGSIGYSHNTMHSLVYANKDHPLSWLTTVNSLHHQAVRSYNRSYRPIEIVAVEPSTGLPEIMVWGDSMLGVQFHPELFNLFGKRFFDQISEWVRGDLSLTTNQASDSGLFRAPRPVEVRFNDDGDQADSPEDDFDVEEDEDNEEDDNDSDE